MIKHTKLWKE